MSDFEIVIKSEIGEYICNLHLSTEQIVVILQAGITAIIDDARKNGLK